MTTPSDAPDWRKMSQEERDLGLNNGVAVAGSAEMVAGWEQRSAEMRKRHPRASRPAIWPARAQPDRFPQGRGTGADAAVHPRRLLADAGEGGLCAVCRRSDGAWHQCRADRLHAGAGCDARRDRRRNPCRDRLSRRTIARARRRRRRHRGVRLVRRRAPDLDGAVASEGEGGHGDHRASTISSRSATAISTRSSGSMKRRRAATRR